MENEKIVKFNGSLMNDTIIRYSNKKQKPQISSKKNSSQNKSLSAFYCGSYYFLINFTI